MSNIKHYKMPLDFANNNWLQVSSLGGKEFDNAVELNLRGTKCILYSFKDKVVGYKGDKILIEVIKPYFEQSIETFTGSSKKIKNTVVFIEEVVKLNPGDKNYVDVVLLDCLQNKLGMDVE